MTYGELRDQLIAAKAALESAKTALNFYAENNHETSLRGKMDWAKARQALKDRGFEFSYEYGDGTEYFVESGRLARAAVDDVDIFIESMKIPAEIE